MTPTMTTNIGRFVLDELPEGFLRGLVEEDIKHYRIRIFPWALIVWMMLCQRLGKGASLAAAIAEVRQGKCEPFLERAGVSKLVRGGRISDATGGYSQARNRIPLNVVEGAADHLNNRIRLMHSARTWEGLNVYLIDGSSLTLPHSKELLGQYPSCHNQHGKSHWPKMRICCVHDLVTGVALRPEYGPLYGAEAVGELGLLKAMLNRVPAGVTFVADRLYGTFDTCFEVTSRGHPIVVRLSDDRSNRFLKNLKSPGEIEASWVPSAYERRKYLDLPQDAAVPGRFIWYRLRRRGYRAINLYLFTTLQLPLTKIVELYGLRWGIENDIRDIKECLKLDEITAKTSAMVHKEVVLAHVAYNLVRHVATIAAEHHRIEPRRVSFKRLLNYVTIAGPTMLTGTDPQRIDAIDRLLSAVPQLVNRKRSRPPQPRKILMRRSKFSEIRESRQQEQRNLLKLLKNKLN